MGLGPDDLRDKALLALEEALQDLRYDHARRSFAVRFALAYLWAYRPGPRGPFEDFWRALASKTPWRVGDADTALGGIYEAIGAERNEELAWKLWRRAQARYGCGVTALDAEPDLSHTAAGNPERESSD